MRWYWIGRGNREIGPYRLEEIHDISIEATDLIRIEGQSQKWVFPHEIYVINQEVSNKNEIQQLRLVKKLNDIPFENYYVFKNSLGSFQLKNKAEIAFKDSISKKSIESCNAYNAPYGFNKALNPAHIPNKRNHSYTEYMITALAMVLFLIGYHSNSIIDAANLRFLAVNHIHTNRSISLPEGHTRTAREEASYQNAIGRDIVMVNKEKTVKGKKLKPFNWKKQVILLNNVSLKENTPDSNESNFYLQNMSSFLIDEALIQVQYILGSGKVIGIEEFVIRSIPPHAKRKLEIPPCKKGIQIKYKLIDIYCKENQVRAVEI